jgi:hypothetical protein
LIINELSVKTNEKTGNKPAKPEINNKPNMNPIDQIFNTHSFGVDYIYGRHGSRFPTGELKASIFVTTMIHTHQIVPHPTTKINSKCTNTGKVNSIDNQ